MTIDTLGAVDEYFINKIGPLVHMYHTSTCSNTNCPMKEHITRIDALAKQKNENQSDLGLLETDKKSEMIAKDGMPFLSVEI
uniref:Uncharacterized protein n=1 Tax=Romanomermis culicivorax TaxID=13658 RepID=A0A915KU68_ROMCU